MLDPITTKCVKYTKKIAYIVFHIYAAHIYFNGMNHISLRGVSLLSYEPGWCSLLYVIQACYLYALYPLCHMRSLYMESAV